MPQITRITGIILAVTGIAGYFLTGAASITALIPAMFGAVFMILAMLAVKESRRKHVMHAAVLLALVGLFGSFTGLLDLLAVAGGQTGVNVAAAVSRSIMAVVCIVYIGLGVKSFIDARKG